ncbi:hypothetical protein AQ914_04460 [Burkholderia pseudomallei]|nr:hypothetical protein AQ914_04460 [Burkholderia pseudomallei]
MSDKATHLKDLSFAITAKRSQQHAEVGQLNLLAGARGDAADRTPTENSSLYTSGERLATDLAASDGTMSVISDMSIVIGMNSVVADEDNNMNVFAEVVEIYTEFYQDLTNAMTTVSDCISADSDTNYVDINVTGIVSALSEVVSETATLSVQLPQPVTSSAISSWQTELGSSFNVSSTGVVTINTDDVASMISSTNGLGSGTSVKINTAQESEWQSEMDSEVSNVETDVQTLVDKYSDRQSTFDNLVKVMSTSLTSMSDMWKSYLDI